VETNPERTERALTTSFIRERKKEEGGKRGILLSISRAGKEKRRGKETKKGKKRVLFCGEEKRKKEEESLAYIIHGRII